MRVCARLPKDRERPGTIWVVDDVGAILFGPVRARGEADNARAAKADNVREDPTQIAGDHPYGVSRIVECVAIGTASKEYATYGPWFIRLNPVSGEAWTARQNGRTGIGAHGGHLGADDVLRATHGCLRVDNETITAIVALVDPELQAGRSVFYECLEEAA